MKREINIPNQDKLTNFFNNYKNINTVYIFGSHGTEYENDRSDLDLGILFLKPPEILRQMNLEAEIEETIGQEVDIVSLNKCNILSIVSLQFEKHLFHGYENGHFWFKLRSL